MSFLPMAERDLRVAARRKFTFILRGGTALLAMLMCGPTLLIGTLMAMGVSSSAGLITFNILAHYVYILCLLAGIFLAADSLSEERREGTLGLLFLTDLRGYDVVLGKFLAIALNAFYALLAIFPILALPLLTGGVTGAEFWRMNLALVNALFFSIAAAVWISSETESSFRAVSGTFAFLLICGAVCPIFVHFQAYRWPVLSYLSMAAPYDAMRLSGEAASVYSGNNYWFSLGVCHLCGWVFLGLASWRLPRSLEAKTVESQKGFWRKFFSGDFLTGTRRRKMILMEQNPILWLLADSARMQTLVWITVAIGCLVQIGTVSTGYAHSMSLSFAAFPFFFVLKILFVIQACRFFSEARRTGSLELLCCTPLTDQQMIQGQWRALRRIFLLPVSILVLVEIGAMFTTTVFGVSAFPFGRDFLSPIFSMLHLSGTIADFFALGWFGMWLALSGKKPGMATGWAILFILILPWIPYCLPQILVDIVFIAVTKSKLKQDFRSLISGTKTPARIAPPKPLTWPESWQQLPDGQTPPPNPADSKSTSPPAPTTSSTRD